jgi:GMP synthase-like glutamine amidotransferase
MRVLSIVHEHTAGSGVFGEVLRERGEEVIEWVPPSGLRAPEQLPGAVMVFGGAMNCDQEAQHPWLVGEKAHLGRLLAAGVPALGVCLGAQLLAEVAGGSVTRMDAPEIGWCAVELEPAGGEDPVLGFLPARFEGLQWHSYRFSAPPGAQLLARSPACVQAFRAPSVPWWGIQFHAEVTSADFEGWIDDYASDPDAVAAGIDWPALRAASRQRIAGWNSLGEQLCRAFLEYAESSATAKRVVGP